MANNGNSRNHVVVVGAGPGGLTAAMILAHRGFKVSVFEKEDRVGGRNRELRRGPYSFDVGPTFLMMRFLLDEMFREVGRNSEDCLQFLDLNPMYRLSFEEFDLDATTDVERMRQQLRDIQPGEESRFDLFLSRERVRFERMYPCLQKPYSSPLAFLAPIFLRAIPHLAPTRTLYGNLSRYFDMENLRLAFTFQSKYLGMSPWECPAAFTMLPYLEYAYGIYHVMGGLCRISEAMSKVVEEEGGEIHLSTPVARVLTERRRAVGVELEDGRTIRADEIVLNADFGYAMTHLFEPGVIRKYAPEKLRQRKFSCSTFMLYLGISKRYDFPHHCIVFAGDYKRNVDEIAVRKILSEDPSIYVRNASQNDPSLAPEGHSAVYVLVPVPNNTSGIDWEREKIGFRDRVLDIIAERTSMTDIRDHIVEEAVITPSDWEHRESIYLGATFNLAHNIMQMTYFRPRNRFEELERCYLVGGGTHPGSGLPTIYESGRISANLICDAHGVRYAPAPPLPGTRG